MEQAEGSGAQDNFSHAPAGARFGLAIDGELFHQAKPGADDVRCSTELPLRRTEAALYRGDFQEAHDLYSKLSLCLRGQKDPEFWCCRSSWRWPKS